jgi:tetratricopeptide (TPR) repeat protein
VRVWIAGLTLIVAAAGGAWWYGPRTRPPAPPVLAVTDGADPAVVAAVAQARQKVLAAPRSAADWGELGMVFGAHGYEPEADTCFTEAGRLDPADARWPYLRGVYLSVTDPPRAVPLLRRGGDLVRNDPEALSAARLRLAEVYLGLQQLPDAETLFREELDRSPIRATFDLGQVALARGDRKAAREATAAVAESPFVRKRAAILLAALAREAGDGAGATRYEAAARQFPDDPSWPDPYLLQLRTREVGRLGLLREAEALEAAGQLPRATGMLVDMARADPTPRLLVSAGIALGKLREFDQAEAMFRECLKLDPGHAQAHFFLAVMLFEQAGRPGPPAEAEEHAAKAVDLKPDHGLAWLYLGRIRLARGDAGGAVQALRQAVACRPEFTESHLYLAEALAADGKSSEATVSAMNAEKLAGPGDTRPRQLLARLRGR